MVQPQATRDLVMYGNLCEAALRGRSESLLVIYHIIQTMQRPGTPTGVERSAVIDELARLGIFRSRAYVVTLLERGNGTFWGLGAGRVWLRGVARVAYALGARRANTHRQIVSTRDLGTPAARRGALLGVTLPRGRPIRQHTIRGLTNVTERTQRRYRHAGAFGARRQDADVTTASGVPPFLRWDCAQGFAEHGVYVAGGRLMKRIPNSYTPKGVRIPSGRRSKEMFTGQPLNSVAVGENDPTRLLRARRYVDAMSPAQAREAGGGGPRAPVQLRLSPHRGRPMGGNHLLIVTLVGRYIVAVDLLHARPACDLGRCS
jgi:hypothetical protein